ncbi:RHS repeat-associated core domain-containing protein [Streptomyces aculeolatus]|uniref:RHS repeat-associated core domain-containing protein n=1 Tax=Streptomyces aculeolatus TaxID=270689 RepID=UPI001CEC0F3B|nr:RHS repeat-associated core domain-containing protein [Streptomyces aculeolatus]
MTGTLLQATPTATAVSNAVAGGSRAASEAPDPGKSVPGGPADKVKPRKTTPGPRTPGDKPQASWAEPGTATVNLAPKPQGRAASDIRAGDLPIRLSTPSNHGEHTDADPLQGTVRVEMLDRATARSAGIVGPVFTLESQPEQDQGSAEARGRSGAVDVTLDYADFAESFGGAYGSRLTLTELRACALTRPVRPECRTGEPVKTTNDTEQQTLNAADVVVGGSTPTILAAVAAEEGGQGDFKATPLTPSAAWNVGLNTGDFTWGYDFQIPQVPGGLHPTVQMSYSSGSVDGRTGGTNNQSSWVGDGFDLWPGYIERRYKSCSDDGVENPDGNKPGDQCWGYDNAFLAINGKGGELVPAGNDEWKLKKDDGTLIKRLTSSDRNNGDNNDEYWRVTDPNGVRYYYGYHRLPGWASGDETTDSTWNVPVFGDDADEPCHDSAGFGSSWCQQAWRWNLDYVVDPHGNAIAYYYNKEENSYGRNLKATNNTRYDRGGNLDRIEYGLKSSAVYGTKPLAKVDFTSSERCLPNTQTDCGSISTDSFYWYDTPWDLNCSADVDCDNGRLAPTFWTRKRLTGVNTEVLKSDGSYASVDSWKLQHRWGQADIDYQLLLDSIQRTGHTASPTIALPKTTFTYIQKANRLDKTGDGYAPFIKARLSDVEDEYGGRISVNYSGEACSWDSLPTPQSNTTRCFPQYIGGSSSDDPERQWFNKYVATFLTETDRTGGAPDKLTRYEYLGGAAWHYDDDDGLTKEKFKTWSQWRGYDHVRVKTGGAGGESALKSQKDSYFLRGMHGDRESTSGGTRSVQISLGDGEGDPITDHESAAGFAYKTVDYSAPDGKVLSKTVNRPWHHQTAKKERNWGTVTANFSGTAYTKNWVSLDQGAGSKWRVSSTASTHDTVAGRITKVDDFGDNSTAADNRCTRTTYATNAEANILTLPGRVETVAASCDDTVDRSKDVVNDVRTAYDSGSYGDTPTAGDATAVATLKSHNGTTATYLESGATYDSYGRERSATDLTANVTVTGTDPPQRNARTDGRTTTIAYTPTSGFPTKVTKTTPPALEGNASTAQTEVRELEPLRGQPSAILDTNDKRTAYTYDALGRTTKIWLAGRLTGTLPDYEFTYFVEENQPVAVATRTLGLTVTNQIPSYTLYDGFLRERQTQTAGPNGGRLIADNFYDERGLVDQTFAPYHADGGQSRILFEPNDAEDVETQTRHVHDGLGRETENRLMSGSGDGGEVLATTKTTYHGDRVTVVPPVGDTTTTTLTDARGQTTEVRQHHERSPTSSYDTIAYDHTPRGELAKVTDPAGNAWTYTYDQLGRQVEANDPDKGKSTSTYDDRGQLVSSTDARDVKLVNIYDGLGRQTELREGAPSGELRAKWIYDTLSGAQGQLAESTRYVEGSAYTHKVTQYDDYYRPSRQATVIPPAEGALAGTYQEGTAYTASGLVKSRTFSTVGNIAAKGWNYEYDPNTQWPLAVVSDGVRSDTTYTLLGKPYTQLLGATGDAERTKVTNTYEGGTQRLKTSRVDRPGQPGVDQHNTYQYDQAGNFLSISDVSRTGTDTQCFTYDHLRRLTEAWTEADTACETAPPATGIGGPAPYWQTFTYDKVGNRLTEAQHDIGGDTSRDVNRTYTYPAPGTPQPHTLTSVTTEEQSGTATDNFSYDPTGNTTTRSQDGASQQLTWDAEGQLRKVDGGAEKVTDYVYDADGNRLIARTPSGATLYWGDHTEVFLPKGSTTRKATRYVPLGNGNQAVLENDGNWSLTLADHNGTGNLAIDADTLNLTQRRNLPFGALRGTPHGPWPGTRGFVGGVDDTTSTGLQHLGAREYDPLTGRFLSVDPIMDPTDPESLHGYSYAGSSPLTFSDPEGLSRADACGVGCPIGGTGPGTGRPIQIISSSPTNYNPSPCLNMNGSPCGSKTGSSDDRSPSPQPQAPPLPVPDWVCDSDCVAQHIEADSFGLIPAATVRSCDSGALGDCGWLAAAFTPWGKAGTLLGRLSKGLRIAGGVERLASVHNAVVAANIGKIRSTWNIGKKRVVASGVLQTEDGSQVFNAASGPDKAGLVGKPSNPVFETVSTSGGKFSRGADAEYKILERAAEALGAPSGQRGILTLQIGKTPCTSCGGVIDQFAERYPNVWIRIGIGE